MAIKISGTTVIDDSQGLRITGISTFTNGPVLVGSATSTGTASQRLQVTGGAYVSGNFGVGTTNPIAKLQVSGGNILLDNNTNSSGNNYIGFGTNAVTRIVGRDGNTSPAFLTFNIGALGESARFDNVGNLLVGSVSSTGTASQPLQVTGGGYFSGSVGIGSTNPTSTLSVGGTITELYSGTYWNLVSQADIGIGASQVPLNQYLGQLAFLDAYSPSGLRRDGGGADDLVIDSIGEVGIGTTNPTSTLHLVGNALVVGVVTATSFSGNGAGLTGLNIPAGYTELDSMLFS